MMTSTCYPRFSGWRFSFDEIAQPSDPLLQRGFLLDESGDSLLEAADSRILSLSHFDQSIMLFQRSRALGICGHHASIESGVINENARDEFLSRGVGRLAA